MISLTLPVPPTSNNLFPTSKSGRRFPSKAYKDWKTKAAIYFETQIQGFTQLTGRIDARYEFAFPDKRRRDIANFEKGITDFLVSRGVMEDDSQIDRLELVRGSGVAGVKITLNEVTR